MADLLIRNARIVAFRPREDLARAYSTRGGGDDHDAALAHANARRARDAARPLQPSPPRDIRIRGGRVCEVGVGLTRGSGPEIDVEGAFVVPGLWEAHAHLDLEAARAARLDTSDTACAEDALAMVARALAEGRSAGGGRVSTVQGFGHRLSAWPRIPTVAELDAVSGDVATVLISGDVHSGWVNSAALRALGLQGATPQDPGAPLSEDTWFEAMNRLDVIPGTAELRESGYRRVLAELLGLGLTGVVDMTQPLTPEDWPRRVRTWGVGSRPDGSSGAGPGPALEEVIAPRIRASLYRGQFEQWRGAGIRTGDTLPGSPLLGDGSALFTQGPLKVISDGSMGTQTAFMREAYPRALGLVHDHGIQNMTRPELTDLLRQAREAGLEAAIHAIGDAAMDDVVAAFESSGTRGRIEHAQLLPTDARGVLGPLERIVGLGLELSVQPAHLVDDWAFVGRVWPGLESRVYSFADMVGAGALLAMGSDAPVARPDPWLAMSVAVGRETPGGEVWSPEQRLTPEEALAASVDGQGPVGVGSRGDVVVLDSNPFGALHEGADGILDAARQLAGTRPVATILAGQVWGGAGV